MKNPAKLMDLAEPDLPDELRAHLPIAEASAAENLDKVKTAHGNKLGSLQAQLRELTTPKVPAASKLLRLRHLAGEWSSVFASKTACSKGCSHCCSINTAVPRSEAKLIAKELGLMISEPAEKLTLEESSHRRNFIGTPCSFLNDGKCSIYRSRPMVCRTLVNMDSVDLLCRLVPGVQVPVPYLNTSDIQGYFAFLTHREQFADIRDWFPKGLG